VGETDQLEQVPEEFELEEMELPDEVVSLTNQSR